MGPSREVTTLAELADRDRRTVTAWNLAHILALTRLNFATAGWLDLKAALPGKEVTESECCSLGLLDSLSRERAGLKGEEKDTKHTVIVISSMCST